MKAKGSTSETEERAAKDLATENANLKLAQSTETFKHTQQMYDKGMMIEPKHYWCLLDTYLFYKACFQKSTI